MNYVNLGHSGTKVSRLCLGCMTFGSKTWRDWVLDEEESRPIIRRAIEGGINFFDTADVYSEGTSEEVLGRALKDFGPGRDRIVVATKVFSSMGSDPNQRGLSRKHIVHAAEASLRRLGTDYIDLYQLHRFDPETPIEETIRALDDLIRAGKVLHVGASSMPAWRFGKMLSAAKELRAEKFVTMQNHYNLVYREEEREMIPLCADQGIGLLPWSPLARGFLAGNRPSAGEAQTVRARTDTWAHNAYASENDAAIRDAVADLASKRGVPSAQVALAWVMSRPGVVAPIVGASKAKHLDDAIAAHSITLSGEEVAELERPYRPHPVIGQ